MVESLCSFLKNSRFIGLHSIPALTFYSRNSACGKCLGYPSALNGTALESSKQIHKQH